MTTKNALCFIHQVLYDFFFLTWCCFFIILQKKKELKMKKKWMKKKDRKEIFLCFMRTIWMAIFLSLNFLFQRANTQENNKEREKKGRQKKSCIRIEDEGWMKIANNMRQVAFCYSRTSHFSALWRIVFERDLIQHICMFEFMNTSLQIFIYIY